MKDPISRLLARDAWRNRYFPGLLTDNNKTIWWDFAAMDRITNNYALRVFAGGGCCDGSTTQRRHLETAKSVLSRFTFILDIECLNEGMMELAKILEIPINKAIFKKAQKHGPSRDRIPFEDVYDFLAQKNKLDIELYEWAKELSLVNCSALDDEGGNITTTNHWSFATTHSFT